MRRASTLLIAGAMLSLSPAVEPLGPGHASAQFANHVSFSLGFGLSWGGSATSFGFGSGYHDYGYYDDAYGLGYDSYRPAPFLLRQCWDPLWFDPFADCGGFFPIGFSPFGAWSWYSPWRFGFVGWPSNRYVRSRGFGFGPFWSGTYAWGYDPYWDWGSSWGPGWSWDHPSRGWNRWRRGYDRWAYDDGYGGWGWSRPYDRGYRYDRYDRFDRHGRRVVQRSPLYGPRFKEDPQEPVYVTDNGPYRPVSSAMPRGGDAGRGRVSSDGYSDRRPGRAEQPRTARPRTGTVAGAGDGAAAQVPGRVRTARPRTGSDARGGSGTDNREAPGGRTAGPRRGIDTRTSPPQVRPRPQPTTRGDDSRPTMTTRPTPTRRPVPTIRSAPSATRQPAVRPPTTQRPEARRPATARLPGARRPITTRRPEAQRPSATRQPAVRPPTTQRPEARRPTTARLPEARRPITTRRPEARRPTTSRTPAARSAPTRTSPPKVRSAPPRRSPPQARPSTRGSGSSRAKPRRPARRPGA